MIMKYIKIMMQKTADVHAEYKYTCYTYQIFWEFMGKRAS